MGESASLFIDERDGLTSERECVRMLSLVAHAVGYKQFVGAHNTVDAQMHVVGSIVFFWYGKCRHLPY